MKAPIAIIATILLAGSSVFGQTLFSNFNGVNPFTHGFGQTDNGLSLTWSPTGGIADSPSEAGCVVSAGSSGKVKAAHLGAPSFSLYNGLSYTISEYVQVNQIGGTGDYVLGMAFGDPTILAHDNNLIGVILEDADGVKLAVVPTWQDPAKNFDPAVTLNTQPSIGDWVRLTLTVQETDVATGAYAYTVQVDDFGPTGVGTPTSLLAPTSGTITDATLGGHATAGWLPGWKTTIPGNAFDNLAVTPTPGVPAALVATKGEVLETSTLTLAGPPAIDAAGDVAFHATVDDHHGTQTGILLFSGTTFSIVADVSSSAPGTNGAVFEGFSDPALSGSGALAFYGTLKPGVGDAKATNDAGIWVSQSGTTTLAVRTSGTAPGIPQDFSVPLTYSSFSQLMVNDAGGVDFLAGVHGTGVNTIALFGTDTSGTQQMITVKGIGGVNSIAFARTLFPFVPLPTVAGQSRTFDTVDGNGALIGELNPLFPSSIGLALVSSTGFQRELIAQTGDTVPNFTGVRIASLGEPIVTEDGSLAFALGLTGAGVNATNNSAIGLVTNAFSGVAVRTGSPAPDSTGASTSGTFTALSAPVMNNNDDIAFVGSVRERVGSALKVYSGIWSDAQGPARRVVQAGDPAPGGGTFLIFNQIVLPDVGDVIFLATLTGVPPGQNIGIFAVQSDGSITLVQRTGVLLPVHALEKTVASLQIFQTPPYVTGQSRSFDASTANIVYQATFTDGTWAIYELTP